MNNHECNRLCFLSENSEIDVLLLAGGRGSRLKEGGVCDLPKPLVTIKQGSEDIPMIENCIRGISSSLKSNLIILTSLDPESQSDLVENYIKKTHPCGRFSFSVENLPLGTAGAAYNALIQRHSNVGIILPSDTLFPFVKLENIVENHIKNNSNITWVLTSNPGEKAQNINKILIDKYTKRVNLDLESIYDTNLSSDIDELIPMTSTGVVVVNRQYFIKQFDNFFEFKDYKSTDLYRQYIPKLLEEGQIINSYDIKQPAQDLGTIDRLNQFGRSDLY